MKALIEILLKRPDLFDWLVEGAPSAAGETASLEAFAGNVNQLGKCDLCVGEAVS